MKKYHIVVDFSYLYYKYFFKLMNAEQGRGYMRRLSTVIDGAEVDTTYQYYIGKEIESFRNRILTADPSGEVTLSICFDSKSERKDEDTNYKAERVSRLNEDDFDNHAKLRQFFEEIGYNTYKEEGKEADDLVHSLVNKYKDEFDTTVIYTPDKDLMVNIDDKVYVMRSSTFKSEHDIVTKSNYESYLTEKMKCRVPYNSILLYLSMVGDKVDGINGIKGFGPKAFDKFVEYLSSREYDFTKLNKADEVERVLKEYAGVYSGKNTNALEQALNSLKMAEYRDVEVAKPVKNDSDESRNRVFTKYGMNSLLK